jgi:hypothetical protein
MATRTITESSKGMLIGLALEYIGGIALNVIGEPEEGSSLLHKVSAHTIFALHGLISIGLLVGSIIIYRQAKGGLNEQTASWGLVSTVTAVLGGVLTVSTPLGEFFSFVMALGFLGAFACYGKLYYGSAKMT